MTVGSKVAALIAASGRQCGNCSMCCYLPAVDDPELKKPAHSWCPHCRPGKGGCGIYQQRPSACRSFACVWLIAREWGEEWYPARSRIVLTLSCVLIDSNALCLAVDVDDRFPNRWREEPYFSQLQAFADANWRNTGQPRVLIRVGHHYFTFDRAGKVVELEMSKDAAA